MPALKWSISHAVFVTELDDQHKEIFDAVSGLEKALTSDGHAADVRKALERLTKSVAEHFAHEERLMRAARYESLGWHKRRHEGARKRVEQFVARIERGDPQAGSELVQYLTTWLQDHTRVADRMMGAALRNHRRYLWKLTFSAGTKLLEGRSWVSTDGEPFDPPGLK